MLIWFYLYSVCSIATVACRTSKVSVNLLNPFATLDHSNTTTETLNRRRGNVNIFVLHLGHNIKKNCFVLRLTFDWKRARFSHNFWQFRTYIHTYVFPSATQTPNRLHAYTKEEKNWKSTLWSPCKYLKTFFFSLHLSRKCIKGDFSELTVLRDKSYPQSVQSLIESTIWHLFSQI